MKHTVSKSVEKFLKFDTVAYVCCVRLCLEMKLRRFYTYYHGRSLGIVDIADIIVATSLLSTKC